MKSTTKVDAAATDSVNPDEGGDHVALYDDGYDTSDYYGNTDSYYDNSSYQQEGYDTSQQEGYDYGY